MFEAWAEKGKIVFEPRSIVDRGIAERIAEFRAGQYFGPFGSHKAFLGTLHKEAKRRPPQRNGGANPGCSSPSQAISSAATVKLPRRCSEHSISNRHC